MGKFRTLSILLGLLLISQVAAAQVHHEKYGQGEDNFTIPSFLEDSFQILNETLKNVRDMDIKEARENSIKYDMRIGIARSTLEKIPEIADTYEQLNSSIVLLGDIDIHLASLVDGAVIVLDSIDDLHSFRFDEWTAFSIDDNITIADGGLTQLEAGLLQMRKNRLLLENEILSFSDDEIYAILDWAGHDFFKLSEKEIILNEISTTIDLLEQNRTPLNSILTRLVEAPVNEWKKELHSILDEVDPQSNLSEMSIILEASNVHLSNEMTENLSTIVEGFQSAIRSIRSLRTDQISFLENITVLENTNVSTLADLILSLNNCNTSLSSMEDSILISENAALSSYPLNNRSLIEDHGLVSLLISDYRDRFDEASLFEVDLEVSFERMSILFNGNIMDIDLDKNGTLEEDEIPDILFDPGIIRGLKVILDDLTNLTRDLASLPAGTLPGMMEELLILRDIASIMFQFSEDHEEMISGLKELASTPTRASNDPEMVLSNSLGLLSSMNRAKDDIHELMEELQDHGYQINRSWKVDIEEQLDLYQNYLVKKGYLLRGPQLILSLDRTEAPFDTRIGYSILFIDIHPVDGPFLVSNKTVTLFIDDSQIETSTLRNGMTAGTFEIERTFAIGTHSLKATSLNVSGSNISSFNNFTVRKLHTSIEILSHQLELDVGETEEIWIEVKDELFRSLESFVEIDMDTVNHSIPGAVSFGPLPLGTNIINISYPGDEIFESSQQLLTIDVKQDPLITIGSNRTLFGFNDTVEIEVDLERGNGSLELEAGQILFPLNISVEGEGTIVGLDPHLLGNGTFIFRVIFSSNETWTRSGWSDPLMITINLAFPHGEPEEETPIEDDNKTDPTEDPDPVKPDKSGFRLSETFQWIIFGVTILLVAFLIIFVAVRSLKNRPEKIEREKGFRLPSIYLRKEKEGSAQNDAVQDRDGIKPLRKRSVVKDSDRTRLIEHYLDIIESSPHETGIRDSMTPREVSLRLKEKGLENEVASRLSEDFELSIYRYGEPKEENIRSFTDTRSTVKKWFDTLLGRQVGDDNREVNN